MGRLKDMDNASSELSMETIIRGVLTLEQSQAKKTLAAIQKGLENLFAQHHISSSVVKEFRQMKTKKIGEKNMKSKINVTEFANKIGLTSHFASYVGKVEKAEISLANVNEDWKTRSGEIITETNPYINLVFLIAGKEISIRRRYEDEKRNIVIPIQASDLLQTEVWVFKFSKNEIFLFFKGEEEIFRGHREYNQANACWRQPEFFMDMYVYRHGVETAIQNPEGYKQINWWHIPHHKCETMRQFFGSVGASLAYRNGVVSENSGGSDRIFINFSEANSDKEPELKRWFYANYPCLMDELGKSYLTYGGASGRPVIPSALWALVKSGPSDLRDFIEQNWRSFTKFCGGLIHKFNEDSFVWIDGLPAKEPQYLMAYLVKAESENVLKDFSHLDRMDKANIAIDTALPLI